MNKKKISLWNVLLYSLVFSSIFTYVHQEGYMNITMLFSIIVLTTFFTLAYIGLVRAYFFVFFIFWVVFFYYAFFPDYLNLGITSFIIIGIPFFIFSGLITAKIREKLKHTKEGNKKIFWKALPFILLAIYIILKLIYPCNGNNFLYCII